ncbi:MAG TPA: cytidylate kinase-like family protein [Bryobacteraceae bacterium]|nr:cytidylate kinase-like family protein [Bryobacteraceae bacterium]
MTRVITIGREFGSGGAEMAGLLAELLGWKLIDRAFIDAVAELAKVSPAEVERCDERIDSWFHRAVKALWHGGYEGVASSTATAPLIFDADATARLARRVIDEAAALGECVIVGRGAQCILHDRATAFHVFVYAPWNERVDRIRRRLGCGDPEAAIWNTDHFRENYIRRHFNENWTDPHLYDLMVNSCVGLGRAARTIACAAGLEVRRA